MFKKRPNIKPLAPLRSSERRRVCDKIIEQYRLEVSVNDGQAGNDDSAQSAPDQQSLSGLRKSLLPEGTVSGRFTTTVGPNLKPVHGTIYAGTLPGEEERILWYRLEQGPGADDRIYPTVYTLWHYPRLVPLLHTPPPVMEKLYGGADLMTPGLIGGPPFPKNAVKGAIVAVASADKPSVPSWVGICEIDVASLGEVYGQRGHAVKGLQWEGDELWKWGPPGKDGKSAPEHIEGWFSQENERLNEDLEDLTLEESDAETASGEETGGVSIEGEVAPVASETNVAEGGEDDEAKVEIPEPTTAEIDEAFVKAFLYFVHNQVAKEPTSAAHGVSFPILPTTLISTMITPFIPIRFPQETQWYNIKKTSWKNAKKFIKHLQKLKLVHAKDRSGGETIILDIDFEHNLVANFVPYRIPKKPATSAEGPKSASTRDVAVSGGGAGSSAAGQTLNVKVVYRPAGKLTPTLFPPYAVNDKRGYFTASEVAKHVNDFIANTEPPIVSPSNPRIIKINPFIAENVLSPSHKEDSQVLGRGAILRDAFLKRLLNDPSLLAPHYAIIKPGQAFEDAKLKPGTGPQISVLLERRMGNKVMTRVYGLEPFGVNASLLADELRKKCASSSTTNKIGKDMTEVLVQGDHRKTVQQALAGRGVKAQWLQVVDKTQKKKKTGP